MRWMAMWRFRFAVAADMGRGQVEDHFALALAYQRPGLLGQVALEGGNHGHADDPISKDG